MRVFFTIAICLVIIGLQAVAWDLSGQIGFERGEAVGVREVQDSDDANRRTMEQIGICRWANVYGGCNFKQK